MTCKILTFIRRKCIISASKMVKKRFKFNPYLLLILLFLGFVFLGSLLLSMPFAFKNNHYVGNYSDALFTSLGAMTLTGVTTYPEGLANTLSITGQIIVLVLVQIGGLGIVSLLTFIFSILRGKLQFKERLLISQAIAFNNFGEIAKYVKRLIVIEFVCEVIGIGLGIPVFANMFPANFGKVLYYSTFYSISAFNNAGLDLFEGTTSFINGLNISGGVNFTTSSWLYYYSTIYLAVLSLLGGISFMVIIDIVLSHKPPRRWSSLTKICITMTVILILGFSGLLFLTDGLKAENPMTFYQALMHTINCRTAGFTIYPHSEISLPGKIISALMMVIGGSPLSTAGGVKVTTVFVIFISIISYFRGKRLSAFKRRYSDTMVAKSMTTVFLFAFFLILAFIGLVLFGTTNDLPENFKNEKISYYLYLICSSFGNVGFQTGVEPYLTLGSKLVICFVMFLGHLGPISFFQLFQNNLDKSSNAHYSFVEEDFLIG